ncbi:hypothetical protein D9M69_527460 [compost metagenome]
MGPSCTTRMPLAWLKGSAQACFCASWVVPPQLTKLMFSAAMAAVPVAARNAAASTAVARFLNTILLALIVVFVRKRASLSTRLSGAGDPGEGAIKGGRGGRQFPDNSSAYGMSYYGIPNFLQVLRLAGCRC